MAVLQRSFDELTLRQFHDLLRLRIDVFVVEQNCPYPELDGRDCEPETTHVWIERDGAVAACLRVLAEPSEHRIGRVATEARHRGEGLAAKLMDAVIANCSGPIVLDAQSHLRAWYERFGFVVVGDEFVEDGIPHLPMRRAG